MAMNLAFWSVFFPEMPAASLLGKEPWLLGGKGDYQLFKTLAIVLPTFIIIQHYLKQECFIFMGDYGFFFL